MAITLEDMQEIKKEVFAEADNKYVHVESCTESKQKINSELTTEISERKLLSKDVAFFKKLGWAIATASIGQLVLTMFDLIKNLG